MNNREYRDNRERRNIAIFLLFSAVFGAATNICAEGYIQAYLIGLGFGTQGIRNYGIAVQAASIAAYLLSARRPSGIKELKAIYAGAVLCAGIFPAALAAAGRGMPSAALHATVLGAAALYGFLTAIRAATEFNMAPRLFARRLYGSVTGKASVIGGLVPVGISLGAGLLLRRERAGTYQFLFWVSAAAFLASALFVLLYRLEGDAQAPARVSWPDVLRSAVSPRYAARLLPHLLRGVGMAGMYYIVPSALKNISLSEGESTLLIVIPVLSTIAGSFLYMLLSRRAKSGAITFFSVLACSLLMPPLSILSNKALFFILYLLFFVSNIVSQLSIPTGVLRSTPDGELAFISPMRLLLMSAASSLFIFLFGLCLQAVPPVYIMLLSGAVFAACGAIYKNQFDDHL